MADNLCKPLPSRQVRMKSFSCPVWDSTCTCTWTTRWHSLQARMLFISSSYIVIHWKWCSLSQQHCPIICFPLTWELTLQTTNLFLTLSISLVSRSHSLIFLPADNSVFPFGPSLMHDTPCLSAFHLLRRIKLKSECIYNNTIHNIR